MRRLLLTAVVCVFMVSVGAAPATAVDRTECRDDSLFGTLEPAVCIMELDCPGQNICVYGGSFTANGTGLLQGHAETNQPGTLGNSDGQLVERIGCEGVGIKYYVSCSFSYFVVFTPAVSPVRVRCAQYGPAADQTVFCSAQLLLVA